MFNVIRPTEAPESLAARRSYSEEDVLNKLREIFYDKCYLCEIKDPTSINVEHFDAHQGNLDKKFDWNNLFYVCGRCNNIKLAKYNNLLDCTNNAVDVFRSIKHLPPHTPYQSKIIIEPMSNDDKTIETAALLDEIFNTDKTINKKITGKYLRRKVFNKYNRLLELVNEYLDDELPQTRKDEALERLQALMSRKQEFSAFIRWVVLQDEYLHELLGASID
ncbi:hypothetical protein C9E85_15615 [Plesiomonas shigelloides]|uniref:hypothetical protein n=1 Tax=Plesiomonas shigelloides TaxID=703 RepID=UPI000D56F957|nr:hypothetical protein [Plesiomonas shigelloides]PVU64926.1 hypothetical protein C9E85_15615 [Plesiomonas shigelloides]